MANPKLFGRATIKVAGKLLDAVKGSTLDVGGVQRTSKPTANRIAGFTEELVPSKVECSIPLSEEVSLKDLQALAGVPILFQTDAGKLYTIPKAWLTAPPSTGDSDGNVKLMFEGEPAEEHG